MREDERKMKKRNRKEAQQQKKKLNKNTPMPDGSKCPAKFSQTFKYNSYEDNGE